MFAASKTDSVSGGLPEDKFNYVTMLLHGDGTNGAQNNTFVDSSSNSYTITRVGNTSQGSFSPYGSNWSNYFDGNGTYLSVSSDAVFQFGTGDFTIECWFYDTGTSDTYPAIISSANGWQTGSTALRFNNTGLSAKFSFHHNPTGDPIFSSTNTFTSYQWYHVAVTRSGTSMKMFVNGAEEASATVSASISLDTTTGVYIGSGFDTSSKIKGYVSNVRVVKGTAVYTSAFTPIKTPLTAISGTSLLTCQSNSFKDNSAQNFTLTISGTATSVQRFNPFGASTAYSTSVIGGSGYFDGSGDYLTVANTTNLNLGNTFTIEAWVYSQTTSLMQLVSCRDSSGGPCWQIVLNWNGSPTTGGVAFKFEDGNVPVGTSSDVVKRNAWTHIAVCRNGTSFELFCNGVRVATGTSSTTFPTPSSAVFIGSLNTPITEQLIGYMSDFRMLKGTALYTGTTYTVPTAPLTAITNTSLLLNYTNGAIFDNAMMNDLETVGNAQISTSVVKYGTGSLYFDGSGDWLQTPSTPNTNLGSGNFTVECWFYKLSTKIASCISLNGALSSNGYALGESSTNAQRLWWYSQTTRILSNTNFSYNTWNHVAVVRNGATTTMYQNGVNVGSFTDSINYSGTILYVGSDEVGYQEWNGYLDEVRITKGYARYTANFTPPTAAFFNTGPY